MLNLSEDAEQSILKLGYWDLEANDDWTPNEYLHAETGQNMGYEVQGWSAALYGAIYFGAFNLHYVDDNTIKITVRLKNRDFDTLLVLPGKFGIAHISRKNGIIFCSQPDNPSMHIFIEDATNG